MDIYYIIIDTLALTLLVLIAGNFVASAPRAGIAWLIGLIAFNYACYVLSARQDFGLMIAPGLQIDFGPAFVVINVARNSISAVFLLLVHSLFREGRRLPRVFFMLIALQVFLEEPLGWMLSAEWETSHAGLTFLFYELTPAALQLTFTCFAMYWAIVERNIDLVENRRSLRLMLLMMVAVQGFLSLFVERIGFIGGFVAYPYMYPIHMGLVTVQVLTWAAIVFWMLRRDLLDFMANDPAASHAKGPEADSGAADVARIVQALKQERIYQQMGLTVAELSKSVGIPEYRLRNLIHNRLGYRNFNSLLHHYRINEVLVALQDPKQNHTPILTLALSAGYQSINPFNRAFRELKNMTPSEYRATCQNIFIEQAAQEF